MTPHELREHIKDIAARDGRYRPEAFYFISEAIAATAKWLREGKLPENDTGPSRGADGEYHVSGRELLAGIRKLATERWGSMAQSVLGHWGVHRTEDFGEIVFTMVEDEEMRWKRRECDTRADFAGGYDFSTAFNDL